MHLPSTTRRTVWRYRLTLLRSNYLSTSPFGMILTVILPDFKLLYNVDRSTTDVIVFDIYAFDHIINVKIFLHSDKGGFYMRFIKADEMEMCINFKSMRLSWVFVNIALIIWLVVSLVKSEEIPYILFIIIGLQNIIFFASKLYMTRRMSDDEK